MTDAPVERMTPWRFLTEVLTDQGGVPLGERMDPWQREDFAAVLGTSKNAWIERPRGHSKTQDGAAIALTSLMTGGPGRRIYFAATDADQARLAHDSMRGFIRRRPAFLRLLRVTQSEIAFPKADSVVRVLPADAPGSWGLRPSLILCDELRAWKGEAAEEMFWSLWSSLGKVAGARMIVATTAGWDRNSLCWKVREQVEHDPAWIMSVRGQCASWISPEFLEQQRRLLPSHLFRMLHENEWTEAGGEFLSWSEVAGVFDAALTEQREPREGVRYFLGLDIGTARDRTALAVMHPEGEAAVLDLLLLWQGTPKERVDLSEVETTALDLCRRFRPAAFVMDPSEGLLLSDRLLAKGVPISEYRFTMPSRAALMNTLLQAVRQQRLRLFPHPVLREELGGLSWVARNGVLRPDHRVGAHDDAVMSAALAVQAIIAAQAAALPAGTPLAVLGAGRRVAGAEFDALVATGGGDPRRILYDRLAHSAKRTRWTDEFW